MKAKSQRLTSGCQRTRYSKKCPLKLCSNISGVYISAGKSAGMESHEQDKIF